MSEAERVVDRLNDVALVAGNRSMQTLITLGVARDAVALIRSLQEELRRKSEALAPFAAVGDFIANGAGDDTRWKEAILFFCGDKQDPQKMSLSGHAFDRARDAKAEKKDG